MPIRVISQRDIGIFMPLNLSGNVRCFLHFSDLLSKLLILIYQIKNLLLRFNQFFYKRNIIYLLCNSNTILNCIIPSRVTCFYIFARTAYFFPSLAVWIFS